LYDADGALLLKFTARAHGHRDGDPAEDWPDYGDGDVGLTELASNGDTPTGLSDIDLNTPETNATLYGPYMVNRVVGGRVGNAKLMLAQPVGIRSGILMHTGNWSDWDEDEDMPNSAGCIHVHPDDCKAVQDALLSIGVIARDNPFASNNYPYEPQGLISIDLEP